MTIALTDIVATLRRYNLIHMLGWQDIRQRYRRSTIGPFWSTISLGLIIGTIGIVFSQILKSPIKDFLPFLTAGMIFWHFMLGVIIDGCNGFIAAETIIKQLPIPLFVHILRIIWRNMLVLAHNIIIFPFIVFAVGKSLSWLIFLSIPGYMLLVLNLTWIAVILGIICARFRDLPEFVGSIIQVVFFLTPIMWMPQLLSEGSGIFILDLNPAFHLLEIVRAPMLGQFPSMINWLVSFAMALTGWPLTLLVYGRYKRRIAYWM